MGRETRLFKSQEKMSRTEVGNFLHHLADKVTEGKVILNQGAEDLALEFPQNLILEIQVEDEEKGQKGTQHSLEVEIKWFDKEQSGSLELK